MRKSLISTEDVDTFQKDGVVLIKGLFTDYVKIIRDGIEKNLANPGPSKPTPWHQDSPYYFVEETLNISFWSPMGQVKNASLRCVAGSHKWAKAVLPQKWLNEENFFKNKQNFMEVLDPDSDKNMQIKEFPMDPGNSVAFNFRILHGARGNKSNLQRRAFSLRLVGDDARFVERGERTSPPFPNHGMDSGQTLREDWFQITYSN